MAMKVYRLGPYRAHFNLLKIDIYNQIMTIIFIFFQMALYFVVLIMAFLNAQWFGPSVTELMLQKMEIEKSHGLGNQIGWKSQREAYAKLREQDPKYRGYRNSFGRYHGLSSLCNLVGFLCTTTNLVYLALNLSNI